MDFAWLDNVSFGDGDFSSVFQRGSQAKIVRASATDTEGTDREETESCSDASDSSASESRDQVSVKIFFAPKKVVQRHLYDILHWKNIVSTVCISGLWKKSPYRTERS